MEANTTLTSTKDDDEHGEMDLDELESLFGDDLAGGGKAIRLPFVVFSAMGWIF